MLLACKFPWCCISHSCFPFVEVGPGITRTRPFRTGTNQNRIGNEWFGPWLRFFFFISGLGRVGFFTSWTTLLFTPMGVIQYSPINWFGIDLFRRFCNFVETCFKPIQSFSHRMQFLNRTSLANFDLIQSCLQINPVWAKNCFVQF